MRFNVKTLVTIRETPTITLEPRTMAHAAELFAVLAEPVLYEFIDDTLPASIDALRQKLARSEARKSPDGSEHWLNWVIRDESRKVVGCVQATIASNSETNVAYVIGTAHWGRGIATEAVSRMLDIVAGEFGVRTFFIVAERRNVRSIRVAERLGFSQTSSQLSARKGIAETDLLMRKVLYEVRRKK
jgi:RimJ/RimL family protein N-acetyltransferase